MDENFCIDCVEKHLLLICGLAEEGIGFADNAEKEKTFVNIANEANRLKREIKTSPDFVDLSRRVRIIRKQLSNCPVCSKILDVLKNNPNSPKDLNSSLLIDKNNPIKSIQKGGIQMDLKQVGIINGGQILGKFGQILGDYVDTKYPPATPVWYKKPSTYIDIAGGLGLQLLALYGIKNENMKLLTVVAGSNMLTKVVDIAKEAIAPPAARMPLRAVQAPLRVTPRAPMAVSAQGMGLVQVD